MMTLEELESWVASLKALGEDNTPQAFGDYILTPNELLEHARKNDETWNKIKYTM